MHNASYERLDHHLQRGILHCVGEMRADEAVELVAGTCFERQGFTLQPVLTTRVAPKHNEEGPDWNDWQQLYI